MFDFENTPITEYTRLKAVYDCGADIPVSYYGQWAKIALNNGTILEVASEAELNSLLTSTTTATVAGSTVSVADIKSIEFGTSVTALPTRTCQLDSWTSLNTVKGFHEGLKTIGDYCFTVANGGGWGSLSGNTIILPSTLTSVGQLFLCACGDPNLTVVVNCPVTVFSATNPNYLLSAYEPLNPQYVNGIKIGGLYAAEFVAKYPNRSSAPYRNLYNINTPSAFLEALDSGLAQGAYPTGVLLPDTFSTFSFNWVIMDYVFKKDPSGNSIPGVVLMPDRTMAAEQRFCSTGDNNYDYDKSYVNAYLQSTMLPLVKQPIADRITEVQVPYLYNSEIKTANAKLWIMSPKEVQAVLDDGSGEPLEYWQKVVPIATNNEAQVRKMLNVAISSTTYGSYWLRDVTGTESLYYVKYLDGSIVHASIAQGTLVYNTPAGVQFCVFIESSGVRPLDVTFNANGGSPVPNPQSVPYGSYATKPSVNPTRANAEFLYWEKDGAEFNFGSTPITSKTTLKAKYHFDIPETITTLEDIKIYVNAGLEVPVGTKVDDTYAGNSSPLIVVQSLNSSNNLSYGGAEGVILMREFVEPTSQQFQTVGNNYTGSLVQTLLSGNYYNNCSDELKSVISEIDIPYYNNGSITALSAQRWFIPSGAEVMATYNAGEGFGWDYWKQKTGLSSPSDNANSGRRAFSRSGAATAYWLRSKNPNYTYVCDILDNGSLYASGNPTLSTGLLPGVLACCFIGKD